MKAIRTKLFVAVLLAIVTGTGLVFASEPAYTYTWRWVINDPEVTLFRYQLDGTDGEWTVVDASVTSFSVESDSGRKRLYLQQGYDGTVWSDTAWKDLGIPEPARLVGVQSVPVPAAPVGEPGSRRFIVKLSLGAQYALADGTDYATYASPDKFDRLQPLATLGLVVDNLIQFGNGPWGIGVEASLVYAPYLFADDSSNPTGSVSTGGSDWSQAAWNRFSHIIGFTIAPKVNLALSDSFHLSAFGGLLTSFPSKDSQGAGWGINTGIYGWTAGLGLRWDLSGKFSLSLDGSWNGLPEYRHYGAARLGVGYAF